MENLKLSDSDYQVMCIIWEEEPMSSRRLVDRCSEELGWKKSTTYTVLKKLCERGFAENTNAQVRALVPKDRVQSYASSRFVRHTFAGSLPGFLVAFLGDKTISEREAEELKRLIDEHTED